MTTTFDRYLLIRYFQVFGILFLSTFGLFVVIDAFTNLDAFQEQAGGATAMLTRIAAYYTFQSSLFFDLAGSILAVISVMVVFAVAARHNELYPLLSAGVPTSRLVIPVVAGMVLINGLLVGNQELVIPRIAHKIQASRSGDESSSQRVDPVYDHVSLILIGGRELYLDSRRMTQAKFVLPADEVTYDLTTLKAREATFHEQTANHPAGWRLYDVAPRFDELNLTPNGRKIVKPIPNSNDVFVVTDVSFDQLYNRSRNYLFLSTPELIRRIRNPAYSIVSVRSQTLHLHVRLMRPLINLACVLVAVSLILRKESRSLVGNVALCTTVLAVILGVSHLCGYLGQINVIPLDLAAWGPLLLTGTLGTWLSGIVQT